MEKNKTTGAETIDFSKYAAALGRIKTPKKSAASARNLEKARHMVTEKSRIERAKKAAAARWARDRKANDSEP